MARLEFTRKTRRAILERAAGRCEACQAALKPGEGEIDHILPAALGGNASVANGRLICRVCHVAKTAADIVRVRRADRQRDKNTPAIRPAGKLRGPSFQPGKNPKVERVTLQPRAMFERRET